MPRPPLGAGLARYAKAGALAFEFMGMIAAGVFLGDQLDAHFGTEPWLLVLMTFVGTGVGFYRMVQTLQRFQRSP